MRNNLSFPVAARKAAPVTFCRRVFGLLSLVALSLCSVGVHAEQLELLWNLDPGSRTYLTTDNTQRGLAYNPVSGNVLIVNRAGGLSVNKVSSVDGSDQGTLDVTGISGGTFALNHIAVAEDGAIYAANLVTAPGNFTIYRWANESAAPTIAFAGDIGGPRYGDNIAIRGSGNNVLLAFGQGSSGTNIAFFTSTDGGVTLTPTIITVPGINVGDTRGGFAFYAGDTIISRIAGTGLLRYIGFDLGTSTASLIGSSTNSALVSAMGAWPASNFVATIQTVTGGNGVHNFQLNRFVSPADVVLLDSEPFVSPGNANANAAGAVSFDGANHRVFALEANNGVRAFRIRYPAAITAHPASRTNAIGSSVTFSVTAEGDAPLSYQWKKDGVAIAGATSSSLTIDPVAGTNAGNYAVTVSNPGGSVDSAPATLTTGADIATQPQSQTVALGGPANFSVVASGTAPFGYQWRKNDADISDANSATYSIASASGSDAGNYTVVVTNDHGSITSQVATLTVNLKPQITAHPTNVVTFPGQSVSFSGAAAGDEPLSYQWRLNDNDISGANAATYNIGSAQNSDLGGYVLVVTNPYGAATSQVATLTFHPVPVITAHPQNQTTPMGNSASFSANASGVQVTFQWRSNGVPIVNATNTTLNIASANLSQNGALYDFVASNGSGSATSQPATLTVTPVSGISFDFDTPGQFTNAPYYLTYNNWFNGTFVSPPGMFEAPIGGTGPFPGSGSLDLIPNNGSENSSILLPVSWDFSLPGKTLYASTMFLAKNPTSNNRSTQFGFVTATNLGIADQSPQGFMTVILQSTAQPAPTYELRHQRRTSSGGIVETTGVTPTATLTVSNWYRLNVMFVNAKSAGNSNYVVMGSLQDMGPFGTTPGATNLSFTLTNSADIVNFRNVYLAIRGFENTGVDYRDNTYAWTTPGNIFFVQGPLAQSVTQGDRAQFKAYVDGEGPYTYQWQRSDGIGGFTNIPGARSWNYITSPTRVSDHGAEIRVVVTGPANSITSDPVALSVASQDLAVVSVGSVDGTTVGVLFNQPVDPATAENPVNYSINGVNPARARVFRTSVGPEGPNGIYVVLTPASVLSGNFTVTVSGVTDLGGGAIGAANAASGTVVGLTGYDVNPLLTSPQGENYSFGPGQFIVSGAGVDIWNNADSYRYVYTTRTGDFDVVVKVPYMDAVNTTSKAGLSVRAALEPWAPQILAAVNPGFMAGGSGGLRQYTEGTARQLPNAASGGWGSNVRANFPDVWLRFRRVGNTFLRYSSANGVNWALDGQISPNPIFPETVYLGLAVGAVRNLHTETAQFENYGAFGGYAGATIAIVTQPTNATVAAGAAVNNTVVATATGTGMPASGEVTYVWQRNDGGGNWTNIVSSGVTNETVNLGPLFAPDNGAQFRVIVRAPGAADVTSDVITVTVTDTAVPTIASVGPTAVTPAYPVSEVVVTFSEPVNAAGALNAANYTVTNAAGAVFNVTGVTMLDNRTVVLTVDQVLVTGNYGVRISGVQDLAGNVLATATRTFRNFSPGTAPVVVEVFQDIGNVTAITGLTGHGSYTGNLPTFISYSNLFGYNVAIGNAQDNYGVRAYTYFVPPTTGTYKFWIRGDDSVQLFINTNSANSTAPGGKVLIAELTAASANYSIGTTPANSRTNISLVAGQPYYMEVLQKEGGGNDGFSVMWTAVNAAAPANTAFIPTAQLAYPDSMAPATPVVAEIYTGYQGRQANNGLIDMLISATNLPTSLYIADSINYNFIAKTPPILAYEKQFGFQTFNVGQNSRFDNYLGRIVSHFVAPSNGNYKFFIRADDSAQFWMNTNGTDPGGRVLLGQLNANNPNYTLAAQNITLAAGQRYYIEGIWREGGGGDGFSIAVRGQAQTGTPPNTEAIPATQLELPLAFSRAGAVSLAGIIPSSPTVIDGRTVMLAAESVNGAPPYGFEWYRNGQRILGSTITNLTLPLTMADNGAVYTLVVTNQFSRAQRSVTLTVLPDNTAPTIVRTVGWRYGDGFTIEFDEPVDLASATYLGNYQVSGGLSLMSAILDPSRTRVSIRTSPQAAGTTYTVTVNGVKDASSSANVANTMSSFSTWTIGGNGVLVEVFTNIAGGAIVDLVGSAKFVANTPDVIYYTNIFGGGVLSQNTGLENYGARITGYFIPTNTGYYRFYARSDDASQLWMNINSEDSENPAGRTMLIHVPGANINLNTPVAMSVPVPLNQGQRYYLEALYKEGTGGDYFQMTFRATDANGTSLTGSPLDNNAIENIGAAFFGGVPGNPDAYQVVSAPPSEMTVTENEQVTLSLVLNIPPGYSSAISYQWQRFDGSGYTNIPNATTPTYTFYATMADDNWTYRLNVNAPGFVQSYTTLFHVLEDLELPYIISANSLDGSSIGICVNEPLNPDVAQDPGNYRIYINGVLEEGKVFSATIRQSDPRGIQLVLTTPVTGPYTIEADLLDNAQTPNFNTSTVEGGIQGLGSLDIGSPAGAGSAFTCTNNQIEIIAGGADIWGASDQGHFVLGQRTGDFDVWARLHELTRGQGDNDGITKAGIMIRETLDANARKLHYLAEPPVSIGGRDIYEAGQRLAVNGATAAWAGGNGNVGGPAGIPNTWIRIKRVGNLFTAFRSADGVNWTQTTTHGMTLPETVYVGLAATAHIPTTSANPAATVRADFRDIHIPNPPVFLVQPTPVSQTVALHSSVTYSVMASNPPDGGTMTYRWRRNGVIIPGATTDTLTIPDAMTSDSGVYTAEALNDGGTASSQPVTLTVNNNVPIVDNDSLTVNEGESVSVSAGTLISDDSDPEGDPLSLIAVSGVYPATFMTDFNSGLPAGAAIHGNASVEALGGVADSGALRLTLNANSQAGSFIVNELTPGRRVSAFSASFMIRMADGSAEPADGFSFNFASDLPDAATGATPAEDGIGSGLSFTVDNYRFTGAANTSGMKVRFAGQDVATIQIPTWNVNRYVPVTVNLTAEGNVTVFVDGTNVFGTLNVPWVPRTGRFGFFARTGGQNIAHSVDDIAITAVNTVETSRQPTLGAALHGAAYLDGVLHLTDAVNGQFGSYLLDNLTPGTPVNSFTASFKVQIGSGSADGADGMSFNFAGDLPNNSGAGIPVEDGVGNGLSVCIDNFSGGAQPPGPAVRVKYAGVFLTSVTIPKWNSPNFIPVSINLEADGTIDVVIDGTNVVSNLPTGYVPQTGRFGLYGRTGGLNQRHWVDDLSVSVDTSGIDRTFETTFDSNGYGTVVLNSGNVIYTAPPESCGTDTFYYIVSDGQAGGTSVGTVTVSITETNPMAPLIVACATNRTLVADSSCQIALPDLRGELVVVDCAPVTITQDPAPGTMVGIGSTEVTFTVTDVSMLTATCAATITVTETTPPTLVCPADIVAEATGANGAAVSFDITATDACDATVNVVANPPSGSVFPLGTNVVNVTATDDSGNVSSCSFLVVVRDTTAPAITCPANITAACSGPDGAVVNFTVTTSDAVDPNPVLTCTPPSGSTFAKGTNVVTCTSVDFSGNTNTCSFLVIVEDQTAALLTVVRSGTDLIIAWPQSCTSFTLEAATSLNAPVDWQPVTTAPVLVGDRWTVTLPADLPARYFRLRE